MPGTPEDAAGLLISSIRDNNPTLYLENKYLYRRLKASGPLSLEPIPLGVAKVVREGRDVTLITYSAGVHQGLEIAEELDKEGISVEVSTCGPWYRWTWRRIVNSVKKTSRAVVLHEAAKRMGYGAEIAATIQEEAFWYLDQPIARIGAKNTPTPTSPPLEDAVIPQPAEIADAIRKVAQSLMRLRHRQLSPQPKPRGCRIDDRLRHRRPRRRSRRLRRRAVRRVRRPVGGAGGEGEGRRHLPAPRLHPGQGAAARRRGVPHRRTTPPRTA